MDEELEGEIDISAFDDDDTYSSNGSDPELCENSPSVQDESMLEDDDDDNVTISTGNSKNSEEGSGPKPESARESNAGSSNQNDEIEAIKARINAINEEHAKLDNLQSEVQTFLRTSNNTTASSSYTRCAPRSSALIDTPENSLEEQLEVDRRSIYVGNVDYDATAEALSENFQICGSVNRVTILSNPYTNRPKGYAYVEFADLESAITALTLDATEFCGRILKVMPKRTNFHGISSTDRPPRGGGGYRGASYSRSNWGRGRGYHPYSRGRGYGSSSSYYSGC